MDLGGKLGEMMDAFIEFALNFTNHCVNPIDSRDFEKNFAFNF